MRRLIYDFKELLRRCGLSEALLRTSRYVHQHLLVRKWILPIIGRNPEVYRMYTRRHPRFVDADPFKYLVVNPHRITHTSKKRREQLYGKIVDGDWDQPDEKLTELPKYRALQEYVETGDASMYLDVFDEIRRGADWSYTDANGELERLNDIDALIESLRTSGYLAQEEVENHNMGGDYTLDRPGIVNEITVDIGRDGTLYYCGRGGSHRLFLSQILDIESVTVQVATRHAAWQRIRDEIHRSDTVTDVSPENHKYLSHPDIRGVGALS